MGGPERPHQDRARNGGESDSSLPPELIEAISDEDYACVTVSTDAGTAFVVKAPAMELESLGGTVPISIHHELHLHPQAPVIRTVFLLYDRPQAPMALETFINVADPHQRADFAALNEQTEFTMLFYDEHLRHRLSKRVTHHQGARAGALLRRGECYAATIPEQRYGFDIAKEAIMHRIEWPPRA